MTENCSSCKDKKSFKYSSNVTLIAELCSKLPDHKYTLGANEWKPTFHKVNHVFPLETLYYNYKMSYGLNHFILLYVAVWSYDFWVYKWRFVNDLDRKGITIVDKKWNGIAKCDN